MNERPDIDAIKADNRIEDVAARYVRGRLRKAGREMVGLSPFTSERSPSFYVHPGKQLFKCFSSGHGGDVITLVALLENLSRAEAIQYLGGKAAPDPHAREQRARQHREAQARAGAEDARRKARARDKALNIWRESRPLAGTLAETYLRARGVDLDAIRGAWGDGCPINLRFHPSLTYYWNGVRHAGPAMVGAVRERSGAITGVHRTWLSADGLSKAEVPNPKLTLGVIQGGAGYLTPLSGRAVMGEGYETTLAVAGRLARAGKAAGICAISGISLGNMAGARRTARRKIWAWHEPDPDRPGLVLPESVKSLVWLRDADSKSEASWKAHMAQVELGAAKFRNHGVEMVVADPPQGADFADLAVMEVV